MSGFTVDLPAHFQAQAPGVAMVGSNTRVKGQPGFLGTQADALTFADGSQGFWTVPNTRTRILGTFMVSQSSQGLATVPSPPPPHPVPVLVTQGDTSIRSL
jgi:hypothetical protein